MGLKCCLSSRCSPSLANLQQVLHGQGEPSCLQEVLRQVRGCTGHGNDRKSSNRCLRLLRRNFPRIRVVEASRSLGEFSRPEVGRRGGRRGAGSSTRRRREVRI